MPVNLPIDPSVATSLDTTIILDTDETEGDVEMKELEDHAHLKHVLLSSDAMRHFIAKLPEGSNRIEKLEEIISMARSNYPSEDGWLVLNLSRMQEMISGSSVDATPEIKESVTVSVELDEDVSVSGSLAEAIVAGNVNAAYKLIEHRPMVALADAAADLDAVYRQLQGHAAGTVSVSNLLASSVETLTLDNLKQVIEALTSAVDGTYTDECEAVKMAILKAVAILNK